MSEAHPSIDGHPAEEATARRRSWIGCAVTVAFALATLWASADLAATTRFGPGPGFFVKGLAAAMLVLGLAQAATLLLSRNRVVHRRREATSEHPAAILDVDDDGGEDDLVVDRTRILRFVGLAVSLFGYGLLIERLGFLVSTTLLAFCALTLLGRAPLRSIVEAVVAVLATYALLHGLLGVNLPDATLVPLATLGL